MNDRTHELEKNLLAEKLVHINKAVEPYSKMILAGVAVVVVGAIAYGFVRMNESAKRSDATLELLLQNSEMVDNPKYAGTAAVSWSMLNQANEYLAQGVQTLYMDRDEAETLLEQAKSSFNRAISTSNHEVLRSRAHLGLAMAEESLGDIERAILEYEKVAQIGESDAMVQNVEARVAALQQPETQEFINWFAEQDFAPASPSMPPALPSDSSLPSMPDLDLPDLDLNLSEGLKSDDETPAKPIEGGLEMPADAPKSAEPAESSDGENAEAAGTAQGSDSPADAATEKPADAAAEKPADAAAESTDSASEATVDASKETADSGEESADASEETTAE